ncbi:MAG: efflux RND transporter periplasmic adaptor subunit [Candidatus Riflebacteria bacterium]|nr:efflux RND transporter periplasmic adaptor subunit [Candidatus Riflebacteria bacterium]
MLHLATVELTRSEHLVKTNVVTRQDHDTKANAVAVAAARVASSLAAVRTAELNLDYCSIRSPIEGRAGQRLVDLGNVVQANNNQTLLVIQRLDPIYADFTIAESDLSEVQRNMSRGPLKVQVWLPEPSAEVRTGELTFVDNAVQDATGTVKLRATLSNADQLFWPGRFVRVRLILSTIKGAVLVPVEAVQASARGPFVYVIGPDLKADLRPVSTGQRHGDLVVVSRGVKADERVVTVGHLAIMPGGKVRLDGPRPSPSPSSTASPSSSRRPSPPGGRATPAPGKSHP